MEETLALYDKLVATNPKIERKGATLPYTSINGHMFSFVDKTGALSLRLSEEDRAAFIAKYKTRLSEQHGAVMKEYVLVPGALLAKTKELEKHFAASLEYVSGLKPKATAKSGKAAKKAATKKAAPAKKKKAAR